MIWSFSINALSLAPSGLLQQETYEKARNKKSSHCFFFCFLMNNKKSSHRWSSKVLEELYTDEEGSGSNRLIHSTQKKNTSAINQYISLLTCKLHVWSSLDCWAEVLQFHGVLYFCRISAGESRAWRWMLWTPLVLGMLLLLDYYHN